MRLDFDSGRNNALIISDSGEEINFDINFYKAAKINQIVDVFSVANRYMEGMDRKKRAQLFSLYNTAKHILMNMELVEVADAKLMQVVKQIVEIIDLDSLQYFVSVKSGIIIPSDVKASFSDVPEMFERGKTYLRHEYVELLTMLVMLRWIFPIWGEYMVLIKDIVSDYTCEWRACNLLRTSALYEHNSYKRLVQYIEQHFDGNVKSTASTVSGIGREDLPKWLSALAVVRRLTIIDLTTNLKSPNIINTLHGYVNDSVKNLEKKFKETIKTKKPAGSTSVDGEKDPSFLETYRTKQDIAYGEIDAVNVWLENVPRLAKAIDPTIPDQLIMDVIDRSDQLEHHELGQHNLVLTQWVLASVVPVAIFETIDKISVIRGMVATQALLHHWGMHELALLVTGINLKTQINTMNDRQLRPTEDQINKLDEIYPYKRVYNGKTAKGKPTNYGLVAIADLTAVLVRHRKAVRAPAFIRAADVPTVDRHGHMSTPSNIYPLLADLLIKIDSQRDALENFEHQAQITQHFNYGKM